MHLGDWVRLYFILTDTEIEVEANNMIFHLKKLSRISPLFSLLTPVEFEQKEAEVAENSPHC